MINSTLSINSILCDFIPSNRSLFGTNILDFFTKPPPLSSIYLLIVSYQNQIMMCAHVPSHACTQHHHHTLTCARTHTPPPQPSKYELSWVLAVPVTSCPGYDLTQVQAVPVRAVFEYEMSDMAMISILQLFYSWCTLHDVNRSTNAAILIYYALC